jgi:hypothetical protein
LKKENGAEAPSRSPAPQNYFASFEFREPLDCRSELSRRARNVVADSLTVSFWIKTSDYYTQISITLTVILTEIAFLFSISSSLPKAPYLPFIDAFFLVSFAFSSACISELVAVHQSLEWSRPERAARVRTISRILYPIIYVVVLVALALIFLAIATNR